MGAYILHFADAIIASAKSPEMKASFNNNLPNQTKGVIVNPKNPVNPDSELWAAAHRSFYELSTLFHIFIQVLLKPSVNDEKLDIVFYGSFDVSVNR